MLCWIQMRCSFLIIWVDFSFSGEKGESNKSGYDEVIVLDGWLGVFGFEWALIWNFGEINFSDVKSVGYVSERSTLEWAVNEIVELSGYCVVLFEKHSYSLIIISFFLYQSSFFYLNYSNPNFIFHYIFFYDWCILNFKISKGKFLWIMNDTVNSI